MVLQKTRDEKGSDKSHRHIGQRIDDWGQGNFDALTRDAERTALSQLTSVRGDVSGEQRVATYSRLVLGGGGGSFNQFNV